MSTLGTRNEMRPIRPAATEASRRLLDMMQASVDWEARRQLPKEAEAVRRHILTEFPKLGRAPLRQELADECHLTSSELDGILHRLHDVDLLYLNRNSQEIRVAYPFSTVPTNHLIWFIGQGRQVYAPCAVDALGIPFMFRCDVLIQSSCEQCATPLTIEVRDGAIERCQPVEIMVWVGTCRTGHAATSICPTINFFCSSAHVTAWRQTQPEQVGEALSLGEALYVGKGIFEDLLESKNAVRSLSEAQPGRTVSTLTSVGGLVAAFLASICCIGPVLFAALGVGVGATGFLASTAGVLKALLPYRPLFIGLSAGLLGVAFFLIYKKAWPACASGGPCLPAPVNRASRILFWIATAIAIALVLAPYWMGLLTE